jgi:O-antigen/teichoic acid export membrane protein
LPNPDPIQAAAHIDKPSAAANWRSNQGTRVFKLLVRNQWMMADQALVSGMNFLTTAILARMLGVHGFGVFSVFYIVLQYLNTIPMAINVSPMMSLAPQLRDEGESRRFLRGMAGYQIVLSSGLCAGTSIFLVASEFRLSPWKSEPGLLLPFILTILFFQTQDWFRRFCYVQNDGRMVFWNDVISYMGQVAAFGLLWWLHCMSVNAAYYAIAFTSLAALVAGSMASDIGSSWPETKAAFARTWSTGRTLLLTTQVQWLGSQGIFLIVAAIAGVSAASGIRAALVLMGPVIMFYQLLDNVIPVRAAIAYAEGGQHGLVAYLRRTGVFVAAFTFPLILFACFFAGPIMSAVFGRAYGGFSVLVIWGGVYMATLLVAKWLAYYHRTVDSTAVLARTAMIVSPISVIACLLLTRRYGGAGGLAAAAAGQIVSVILLLSDLTYKRQRVEQK